MGPGYSLQNEPPRKSQTNHDSYSTFDNVDIDSFTHPHTAILWSSDPMRNSTENLCRVGPRLGGFYDLFSCNKAGMQCSLWHNKEEEVKIVQLGTIFESISVNKHSWT